MPAEDLDREREIYRAQFTGHGQARSLSSTRSSKASSTATTQQIVLIDQPSIRDPKTTIGDLVGAAIAKLGENITVSRFSRFKVGEAGD